MTRARKLLLAKIGLLLGSLLIALLVGEAALRIANFKYMLYPDKIEFGWPDPEEFDNVYVSDPDLLWRQENYPERLEKATNGNVDIVFMGCSCTEFGKYDQFLEEQIEERHPGQTISYLNAGVGGWTTFQGLQQLRRDVVPLKPDYITIFYGWNDHWIGFGVQDKEVFDFTSSAIYPFRNIRLVQLGALLWVRFTDQPDAQYPKRVLPEDFRKNLIAMVEEAREAGITPILFTAPTSYQKDREPAYLAKRWLPEPKQVIPVHKEYAAIVREVAAEHDVLLCDLAERFEALPPRAVQRDYFKHDGIHLRPEGDAKMAEFILDCFQSFGIVDKVLVDATANPVQLPGRDYPGGGDPVPPIKEPGDPKLPTFIEYNKTRLRSDEGELVIKGHVLSPHVIDYVVVNANGENIGSASYPRNNPYMKEKHPEYNDEWTDFHFERVYRPLAGTDEAEVRIDLWSGDQVIHSEVIEVD